MLLPASGFLENLLHFLGGRFCGEKSRRDDVRQVHGVMKRVLLPSFLAAEAILGNAMLARSEFVARNDPSL